MRSTFRLLFYINRQKIKKTGKCPVMGRITLDGKWASILPERKCHLNIGMPARDVRPFMGRILK